ncbi:MFS transporter [Conexibacter sp. SYSU D00693]|uniref:MFS transporter n=1 Tax=Conexibacter sp. SYSU D00693 TaxID=2812560 RepID=UPI00196B3E5C|nr:MFS transporter [Conexibacter sp. SYSU D00693]
MAATAVDAWAPLRRPVFRTLYVAQFASNLGTWMQTVGAQWLMGDLGGGPLAVALVQTALTLPVFLTVVPAGVLGDLLDRRRLLMAAQSGMLLVAAALAVLTFADVTTQALLLGLTFCLGLGQALVMPSWQAIQPELVGRGEVPQAATLNGVNVNVARAVGPAVGGVLVAAAGPGVVFAVNAVSFLATVGALSRWARPVEERTLGTEPFGDAILAGARFVRSAPALRRLLVRTALFIVPASALWALLPVVARDRLELESGGYGLLLGAVGVGAVSGAFVLPRLRARLSLNALVAAASVVYALGLALLAVADAVALAVLALPPLGLAWITVMSSMNAGAQSMLPAWARARGLAFYQLVFMGGQALGAASWGVVAQHTSLATTFGATAVALLAGGVLARGSALRALDVDLSPSHHWPEPHLAVEPALTAGPVLVTIEYDVPEDRAEAFRAAMEPVGRSRRRTGATRWALFQDAGEPRRFVEAWLTSTWGEHLRQHAERVTVRDQEFEAKARSLLAEGSQPRVSHLVAGGPHRAAHDDGPTPGRSGAPAHPAGTPDEPASTGSG